MDPLASPLLTDLYQLTMLQAYYERGMTQEAVFEFFVRELPRERGFLVAAGLGPVVDFLESLRFGEEELEWVRSSGRFSRDFADRLAGLRFRGSVDAPPEGTVLFASEPLLRVTASLPEAQLVETRLINLLHYATLVASKAARCVLAAKGRHLVDFGLRRAHGAEAGMLAARSAYLAGFAGTSNVLASARYGMPVSGTMAHSFIQAHDDETGAFEDFALSCPSEVTLLIDTYDTEAGAAKVVAVAPRLRERGIAIGAVRLDSGDLCEHARRVRAILDAGGLREVRIFSSGSLDEHRIGGLVGCGAPIDGFGVGTLLATSGDAPFLECAYKLQEYAGRPRRKRSEGKATLPGRKQVLRRHTPDGTMAGDLITLEGETGAGSPLIVPVMRGGRRVAPPEDLGMIRRRVAAGLLSLPAHLRALGGDPPYLVEIAPKLYELAARTDLEAAAGSR